MLYYELLFLVWRLSTFVYSYQKTIFYRFYVGIWFTPQQRRLSPLYLLHPGPSPCPPWNRWGRGSAFRKERWPRRRFDGIPASLRSSPSRIEKRSSMELQRRSEGEEIKYI